MFKLAEKSTKGRYLSTNDLSIINYYHNKCYGCRACYKTVYASLFWNNLLQS